MRRGGRTARRCATASPTAPIAHLAEDIVPYVALAAGLRDRDLSAPTILHADLDHGFIIMEDLGDDRIVAGDPPAPIEERYEAAVDLLAVAASAANCRTRCRWRRTSNIRCRATIWMRS